MNRTTEYRVSWQTATTGHPQSRHFQTLFYACRFMRRLAERNAVAVRLDVRQVGPWREMGVAE
jgi:hypothetical protein